MCKLLMHVLRLKAAALVNDHTECLVVCLKALLLPFAAACSFLFLWVQTTCTLRLLPLTGTRPEN